MSSDDRVVPASEVRMQVEIDFSVLFGNVPYEAGNLHLFREGLVDIFLCGGVEEPEGGVADGADAADFAVKDTLVLAKFCQGRNQFLMVVYADDKLVAVLNE